MGTYPVIWIRDPEGAASNPQHPTGWDMQYLSPNQAFPVIAEGDFAAVVLDCPVPGWTAAGL
jgi:hypothetical protein